MVFDFLPRFVEECDTLKISEEKALVALPHFLKGRAETQPRKCEQRRNRSRLIMARSMAIPAPYLRHACHDSPCDKGIELHDPITR